MFLDQAEKLNKIQWGNSYLWDIKFPKAPSPFNDWFPAIDIDWTKTGVSSNPFSFFLTEYFIPKEKTPPKISITFLDDMYLALEEWLEEWIDHEIFNDGKGVSVLEECLKELVILTVDSRKELLRTDVMWVFPEGDLSFHGGSTSELVEHSMDFIIVAWDAKNETVTQTTSTAAAQGRL